MKRFWKVVMLLTLVAVICLPGMASAAFSFRGAPLEGGSWNQQFNESGVGLYTKMQFDMISAGDSFESPFVSNFSSGGWSSATNSSFTTVVSQGSAVNNMNFDVYFTGPSSDSLTFNFFAFNSAGGIVESVRAEWSGSWPWNIVGTTASPVPIPAAAWLLGSGLIGLVAVRRRMKK